MGFEYGYCLKEGCGDRFVREAKSQKYCLKHLAGTAAIKSPWKKEIKCGVCEKKFVPGSHSARYCSESCNRTARILRKRQVRAKGKPISVEITEQTTAACGKCGVLFIQKHVNQVLCSICKQPGVSRVIPVKEMKLPCINCKHSKVNKAATYGVECTIGFWLKCKPLNPHSRPLEVRSEALDVTA